MGFLNHVTCCVYDFVIRFTTEIRGQKEMECFEFFFNDLMHCRSMFFPLGKAM